MKKKVLALSLAVVLTCGQMMVVNADTISDLKEQKTQTSSQLNATENKINQLESQKQELVGEIDSLDARLIQTIASINTIKDSITVKASEIETTKVELKAAEETRDAQYEAMKDRIQYFYENGNGGAWLTALLQEGDLSSMLSSAKNTQAVYDYDKKAFEAYAATVQQVNALENQLEEEKNDLEGMQHEQEAEQQSLEGMLEEKKATCSDYESQIAAANAIAVQYQKVIAQQNVQIQELVAEQQRQAAAQEVARKAAETASENKSGNNDNGGSTSSNTGNSGGNKDSGSSSKPDSSVNNDKDEDSKPAPTESPKPTAKPTEKPTAKPTSTPAPSKPGNGSSSSSIGSSVVSYAMQFVGNPYVYGGSSLTNGADCSGFIMSVFANFGYSLPHSSSALRSVGRGVSYSEAQPGDIICYDGHVAIYIGGGAIVHASNSAPYPQGGIKVSDNAAYKTILAVRRVG